MADLPHEKHFWSTGLLIKSVADNDGSLCKIEYQYEASTQSHRIWVMARVREERGDSPFLLFVKVTEFVEQFLVNSNAAPRVRLPCPVCVASQVENPTCFNKTTVEVGTPSTSISSLSSSCCDFYPSCSISRLFFVLLSLFSSGFITSTFFTSTLLVPLLSISAS